MEEGLLIPPVYRWRNKLREIILCLDLDKKGLGLGPMLSRVLLWFNSSQWFLHGVKSP